MASGVVSSLSPRIGGDEKLFENCVHRVGNTCANWAPGCWASSSGCVMLYLIGDFPYRSCSIRERSV